MLYDHLGRPVVTSILREEEAGPTLTGVRQVISGHPAQGMTPERLARILRDAEEGEPTQYLELAEEMEEKDLHYRSVLGTRKLQVSGLDVTVVSASDDAADVAAADLVREWLDWDELQPALFDVLDAVGKGFSVTEIMWETSGRRWLPKALIWRDPRWFRFDPADGRTLRLMDSGGQLLPLSPFKYIVHVHRTKSGLPIRGGLAYAIAWIWLFKNFDIKSWVQFAEIFGHPLRVGKYGAGASAQDKAALLRAVRNIARDAAAIIPESMMLEFVEAKISGNVDLYEKLASYLDRQTSKAVLGQTGTTDTGQHVGTADAHQQVREDIEKSDAGQLAATLNRDVVRPLVDLNLGPRSRYPRIVITRPDADDVAALVNALDKLVPMGLKVETSVIRDKMGLPEPASDAEVLTAPDVAAQKPDTALHRAAHAAWQDGDISDQDSLDLLAAGSLEGWEPMMQGMIDPLRRLLDECDTHEEFLRRLPEVVTAQDTAALTEALARCIFMAKLAGMTGAPVNDADMGGDGNA